MNKTLLLIPCALLAFSATAFALVGETEEELLKRYGKPSIDPGSGGFGTYYWIKGEERHSARLANGKCVSEEMTGVDEAAVSRIMRAYVKPGQVWNGSASFFQPSETRTLKLTGKGLEEGPAPTVKITRDGRKLVFRAAFTIE